MQAITAKAEPIMTIAYLCPCGVWRHALPASDLRDRHR